MPVSKQYRMRIVRSTKVLRPQRRPARIPKAGVKPITRAIFRVFRRTRGYIIARIPKVATPAGWYKGTQIAYFTACGKSGSAQWLDIWNCDRFDGFTDMQRSINDCRVWFSHTGFSTWGSAQTATGRIASGSTVECLIDKISFGPFPFTRTILQLHFSNLSTGWPLSWSVTGGYDAES